MENEIVQYDSGAELRMTRSPELVMSEAALVGKAVDALIKKRPDLVQVIGGRRHPRFELLQIVGASYRLTTRVCSTTRILENGVDGWEATAEAVHVPTGQVVSRADSQCLNDEPNWAARKGDPVPSFQRRSMAQTRAASKALRLAIGWVLGMAGYETTPAEELAEGETVTPRTMPQRKSDAGTGEKTISEAQAKRLYAICKQAGMGGEMYGKFLMFHGYSRDQDVKVSDYEKLCSEASEFKE